MEQAQGKFTSMLPTQDVNTARHLLQQHQDIKKSEYWGQVPKHRDRAQTVLTSNIQLCEHKLHAQTCTLSFKYILFIWISPFFMYDLSMSTIFGARSMDLSTVLGAKILEFKNYDLQVRSDISFISLDKIKFDWKSLCF